ncbi:ABC-type multidrug transport system ATPase subunit [Paucibacter oligotrophus]|uniref:ABC-type multidrug transport system ATPase subunit n=1 Tax=Roseateles oligotrophus TaxID=1769250 RepID=A0A840LDL5_9BURK|nr:ABC-type multidrug transport system ATPase subunit [Roseateles oligotrophus]
MNLLLGGEGRGKTSLLRLIAGTLKPSRGQITLPGPDGLGTPRIFYACPEAAEHDDCLAQDWLNQQRSQFPDWQMPVQEALAEAFALCEHLGKSMRMLSTGSRRKIGLLAAAASAAELTLLDQPFAALDGRSSRVLRELLLEAAAQRERAWLLADYQLPDGLADALLQTQVDLGD